MGVIAHGGGLCPCQARTNLNERRHESLHITVRGAREHNLKGIDISAAIA
jgi:excinuclease UvrABC ATPase subunit